MRWSVLPASSPLGARPPCPDRLATNTTAQSCPNWRDSRAQLFGGFVHAHQQGERTSVRLESGRAVRACCGRADRHWQKRTAAAAARAAVARRAAGRQNSRCPWLGFQRGVQAPAGCVVLSTIIGLAEQQPWLKSGLDSMPSFILDWREISIVPSGLTRISVIAKIMRWWVIGSHRVIVRELNPADRVAGLNVNPDRIEVRLSAVLRHGHSDLDDTRYVLVSQRFPTDAQTERN